MLSHIKVIELASVLAGPDVGMFFAEMGAKVIKIENDTVGGDVTRKWKIASEDVESNVSAYFASVNWNKKFESSNLKEQSDQRKVYELIRTSDIVIVNFKPGDAENLGMDYQTLKNHNPNIIYGEINGYGSESNRVAYDAVLQAETGFMSMNGDATSGPIKMPVALIDVLAAHQLKEGILIALLKKQKTGKGSLVKVSLYDTAISSLKNQASNWLMNQILPKLAGSLHPNIAPYGETFKTKDGKLLILAIGNNKQFDSLLTILGAHNLRNNKIYSNNQHRVINRKKLAIELKPYFNNLRKDFLMTEFIKLNIPVGAINTIEEVFKNKNAQKLILTEEIEGINTQRIKTAVFKISN